MLRILGYREKPYYRSQPQWGGKYLVGSLQIKHEPDVMLACVTFSTNVPLGGMFP